jgi:hypothetical protein
VSNQQTAVTDLESAVASVSNFIENCPEDVWSRATPHDGRIVAPPANHCAAGNDLALGWIDQIPSSRPVRETGRRRTRPTIPEAIRSGQVTRPETAADTIGR